ncbi:two-component sensor histidine kinase, phosphate regulation [unidentified eubacterium SCB49]|nr:two-component sensor histidine kinase, phosphate regulation [unidentified eubacterium SCB49]
MEKFIYKKINKLNKEVSLLESASFGRDQITTDMDTLTKQVRRFTQHKKLEIEALKIRESYRKEFLGNVSHELKTPLFMVQGYVETLLNGALDDENVRDKYLERANKGIERLAYIVKDLDMISRLEVGGLTLDKEKVDIVELFNSAFELLEMKAAKKNISLVFDKDYPDPIYVNADVERIQQVLTNLLDNSIKYGKKAGTTEVSIEGLMKDKTIVRITDNGVGIEQSYLTRIFERFFRVDKTGSRKVGGSGLGLSIVKHIIDAHSEKIYVESQLGIGSEFSFTLENAE